MYPEALGWAAALFGASGALPQVIRFFQTKTTAGVSAFAWQTALGAYIAWTCHGFISGHANVWLPNVLLFLCSLTILSQLRRDRSLPFLALVAPGVLLGVATVALDLGLGPVAFAIASFLPSALSQLAQLRDLMLTSNIRGVSMPFLVLNVVNQTLWVTWAMMVGEVSVMLVGTSLGSLMVLNLVWGVLRHRGWVRARLALLSS